MEAIGSIGLILIIGGALFVGLVVWMGYGAYRDIKDGKIHD